MVTENPYRAADVGDCPDCARLKRECARLERRLWWLDYKRSWREWFADFCPTVFGFLFFTVLLGDMIAFAIYGLIGARILVEWFT